MRLSLGQAGNANGSEYKMLPSRLIQQLCCCITRAAQNNSQKHNRLFDGGDNPSQSIFQENESPSTAAGASAMSDFQGDSFLSWIARKVRKVKDEILLKIHTFTLPLLCTSTPYPFLHLQHTCAEPLPPCQWYQQWVTVADTKGASDFLRDDNAAQIVYSSHNTCCFHKKPPVRHVRIF